MVDFGPARRRIGRAMMSALRGIGELADNLDGRLPGLLEQAGFATVSEEDRLLTPFGPAIFLRAVRSASAAGAAMAVFHRVSDALRYEHIAGLNPQLTAILDARLSANLPLKGKHPHFRIPDPIPRQSIQRKRTATRTGALKRHAIGRCWG
jgi:hypothetical protein